jgi:hypothetical protein
VITDAKRLTTALAKEENKMTNETKQNLESKIGLKEVAWQIAGAVYSTGIGVTAGILATKYDGLGNAFMNGLSITHALLACTLLYHAVKDLDLLSDPNRYGGKQNDKPNTKQT